jgi:SAM-dependent methyltransferase
MYDVQGEVSFRHYWDWGIEAASLLDELIRKYQPGAKRVLEWGCGPARVIRHMPGLLPGGTECFGTDYNRDAISWCQLAIKDVMFVENELSPPLPFAGEYFDVIYALSVLTHLSLKEQRAWVVELCRVLRPSGCLILTTHGIQSASVLLPSEYARFENEGAIVRSGAEEGKRCFATFNHPDHARNHLFAGLHICEHRPESANRHQQDFWILRKS